MWFWCLSVCVRVWVWLCVHQCVWTSVHLSAFHCHSHPNKPQSETLFSAVVLGIVWQPVWKAALAHPWWAPSCRSCHSSQTLRHRTTSRRPWSGYDRLEHQFTGTPPSSALTRTPPDPDCKSISALISFFSLERARARETRREKDNRKERERENGDSCSLLKCQEEARTRRPLWTSERENPVTLWSLWSSPVWRHYSERCLWWAAQPWTFNVS